MSSLFTHSFFVRVGSALLMMPVVLGAVVYGGWAFYGLLLLAFAAASYEWAGMAKLSSKPILDGVLGLFYIGGCFAYFAFLRGYYTEGAGLTLALLFGIWASDTGAYFAGKLIGGPKMAPRISPNKTWAGLGGGLLASGWMLVIYVLYMGPFLTDVSGFDLAFPAGDISLWLLFVLGVSITFTGQAGDLLISMEKRKVGVKDTGGLIPGHGGILDRIDSLLFAAPFFVLCLWALGL